MGDFFPLFFSLFPRILSFYTRQLCSRRRRNNVISCIILRLLYTYTRYIYDDNRRRWTCIEKSTSPIITISQRCLNFRTVHFILVRFIKAGELLHFHSCDVIWPEKYLREAGCIFLRPFRCMVFG